MKRPSKSATPPDPSEGASDRLARAAALAAAVPSRLTHGPIPRQGFPSASPVLPGPSDDVMPTLATMGMTRHRYGIKRSSLKELRAMGCRSLADVAGADYMRTVGWLGYAEADLVRARILAVAQDVREGRAEPGIRRMSEGLGPETLAWLSTRPVGDLAGGGVPKSVAERLATVGYESVAALAREETDLVEDVHGVGPATVDALKLRIEALAHAIPSIRKPAMSDEEWEAAAP